MTSGFSWSLWLKDSHPTIHPSIHPCMHPSLHLVMPASTRTRIYTCITRESTPSRVVRVHSYMHLCMHPDGVHPAMEASNDCITKIGVQRSNYARGWRVGFGSYSSEVVHVHDNRYRRSTFSLYLTVPYLPNLTLLTLLNHT